MRAKIQKINGIYPVTLDKAVYITGTNKTLEEELKDLKTKELPIYLIDLKKYNITKGFINRTDKNTAYTEENYQTAKNNIDGINRALLDAQSKGINTVLLPRGEYTVAYVGDGNQLSITVPSNITFDLNYSTLKVMYDSKNHSPLCTNHELLIKAPWRFGGMIIGFNNSINSKIINGTLIGDLFERVFDGQQQDGESGFDYEHGMENTYGVLCKGASHNCTIENIVAKGFMGDGISSSANHSVLLNEFNVTKSNYVDPATGETVSKDGCLGTDFIDIKGLEKIVLKGGIGYTRIPKMSKFEFNYVWYTKEKTYIGTTVSTYLSPVVVPHNAKFFKAVVYGEDTSKDSINYKVQFSDIPTSFLYIKGCTCEANHRGGITGGASQAIIENCQLFNNGCGDKEGVPLFPDTTRYQFNQEDSYSEKVTIRNCRIDGTGANGLLIGANYINVESNTLINCNVCIYTNINTSINNNEFISLNKTQYFSAVSLQGSGTNSSSIINVNDNRFTNCVISHMKQENQNVNIYNNSFIYTLNDATNIFETRAKNFNHNTISCIGNTKFKLKILEKSWCNIYENVYVEFSESNKDIYSEIFNNCEVSQSINQVHGIRKIVNCEFNESNFSVGWTNDNFLFQGCKFKKNKILARVCVNQDPEIVNKLDLSSSFVNCIFDESQISFDTNVTSVKPFNFVINNCTFLGLNKFIRDKSIGTCKTKIMNSIIREDMLIDNSYSGSIENCHCINHFNYHNFIVKELNNFVDIDPEEIMEVEP